MQVIEATLLTGPYDWDETLVPRAEFEARLAKVRHALKEQGLTGLIVGGNAPEQGGLSYLTNYVPKMQPAVALVTAEGPIQMRCMGGGAMRDAAQRLTWVEDLKPMREPEKDIEEWVRAAGFAEGAKIGLWGEKIVPSAFRRGLAKGVGAIGGSLVSLDAAFDPLRRRKSELEIGLLRRASAILKIAVDAIRREHKAGTGARAAAVIGEQAAYAAGAQDVRLLVSLTEGGVPRPLEGPANPRIETMLACVMVRFAGYWAEGLITLSTKPLPAQAAAEAALAAMLAQIRPGASAADLARAGIPKSPYRPHPLTADSLGNGIGLSREEEPLLGGDASVTLGEDEAIVLRAGARGEGGDNAVVSAMLVVRPNGPELLWK